MFALYAIPVGIVLGLLAGGRMAGLAALELRWARLALAGLGAQVALFLPPVAERVGAAGPPLYVASSAIVLVVLLANLRMPGLWIVAAGAILNLAAIVANAGSMPASPAAMAALDKSHGPGYSNSVEAVNPALQPLTDIFAMPEFLPFANVFSIGDVVIAVGIAATIVLAMRGGVVRAGTSTPGQDGPVPMGHGQPSRSSHTVASKVKDAFR